MRVDDYCHQVIRSTKLDCTAQAVLWAIAYHVNRRTGETFLLLGTIADDCQMSLRNARRGVHDLREAGVFQVVERRGKSSLYRFPLHPALSTPRTDPTGVEHPHPGQIRPVPRTDPSGTPDRSVRHYHSSNQVSNRAPLHVRPRPDLVATGLYDEEHWNIG